jgi:hypothetical protein
MVDSNIISNGGRMRKLLNIYFNPKETFTQLNEKPDWIIPISITLVVIIVFTMLALPKIILPERAKMIEESDRIPEEFKERQLAQLEGVLPYVTTPVTIIIFSFILLFLQSSIFLVVFLMFGSRAPFKKILAVVSYSYLTGIPEIILKTGLMFIRRTARVFTSLALVVPNLEMESPLFRVLARIDIFMIWQLSLIALGCSVIYGVSRKKSFGIIFGLWGIWLIIVYVLGFVLPKGIMFQ